MLFGNKNDMLQLVMDKAIPKGESTTVITQRVLLLNFAAINTTTSVSGGCRSMHTHYVRYYSSIDNDAMMPFRSSPM